VLYRERYRLPPSRPRRAFSECGSGRASPGPSDLASRLTWDTRGRIVGRMSPRQVRTPAAARPNDTNPTEQVNLRGAMQNRTEQLKTIDAGQLLLHSEPAAAMPANRSLCSTRSLRRSVIAVSTPVQIQPHILFLARWRES